MSTKSNQPNSPVPSIHGSSEQSNAHVAVDDAGRSVLALLARAADKAKEDTERAMDLVHRVSSQLQAAEDRLRQLEAESAQYRDRAARAEAWMLRIQNELEQTFFQNK